VLRRLALLLALVAVAACDTADVRTSRSAPGSAVVERVVDGDTVVLSRVGTARLIGVDTPEVHRGVECFGRAASAYAERVLDGRRVRYRFGVERRDRYGRALVYLRLLDGRFFNAMLVRDGYAVPLTIPPNVEYADRFVALAREARRAGRGLWSACRALQG
jgi:micrococcal nuclease